jgi:hypothetical protein
MTKKGHYLPFTKYAIKYLKETAEIWTNPLKNKIAPESLIEFDGYKIASSKEAFTLGMTEVNSKKLKKLLKNFKVKRDLKALT